MALAPTESPTAASGRGVAELGARARKAAADLRRMTPAERSRGLEAAARELEAAGAEVLDANRADVVEAEGSGVTGALVDRLTLTPSRLAAAVAGLRGLATRPDPVGAVVDGWVLGNGLRVRRERVPLGVVGVIYEARPNVTAEAFGVALRAGNAILLRGSRLAARSNAAIAAALAAGVRAAGLPDGTLGLVDDPSREEALRFMQATGVLDCLVPRGGPALLATVAEQARVPVIVDGAGNCHLYVDRAADLEMALAILENAKTSRPGVCNAVETLLVHRAVAATFLPAAATRLPTVEFRADSEAAAALPPGRARPAGEEDWSTEFLDLVLAVRVVGSVDQAIEHIARYGTGHSETIVTEDRRAAEAFLAGVDAAAVLVNASSRFVDGGELGFGGEIGISTQKLHVRGPMGPEALTSLRLVVEGDGQVRV